MASPNSDGYEPSYRERDVDETLDHHERRLTRIEKLGLLMLGYLVADAPNIATELLALL